MKEKKKGKKPFIIGVLPLKLSIADLVRVKAEKRWCPQKGFTKENLIIVA